MILFDMQIQKPIRGEVLSTLHAAVYMRLAIMNLVVLVRSKIQRLPVRGQRTAHHFGNWDVGILEMDLGAAGW